MSKAKPLTLAELKQAATGKHTMKTLSLSNGKVTVVDKEDHAFASQWKWSLRTVCSAHKIHEYAARLERPIKGFTKRNIYLHRELLNATPGQDVDHIDHDGLNNQRFNLRLCNKVQNAGNMQKQPNTTSRFKGVWFSKASQKWCSMIQCNGQRHYLGVFVNEEDAAQAYADAARKLFGEFAYVETSKAC